jgi:putative Mg2+ transporter-C (MgtC) family protein
MSPLSFLLDTTVALLMGIAIGAERQFRRHPAGLRTNALVCIGSALFVSMPRLIGATEDPTRMASTVVSGLGFLGGGVILREGLNIRGLNTAATLWCSGAVGSLCGAGFPLPAIMGTALILGVNLGLQAPSRWIDARRAGATDVETGYQLRVECEEKQGSTVRAILVHYINGYSEMTVQGVSTVDGAAAGYVAVAADVIASQRKDREIQEIMSRLNIEPGVRAVSWSKVEHAGD